MPLGNNIVNGGYSPCASFSKLIHGNHSDKTLHAKGILDPGVVCFKEINNLKSRNLPSSHHQATSLTSHNHSPRKHIRWPKKHVNKKHCLQKGPYFKDLVLNKDLFCILGPYSYFRVLIFTILASFTQRMPIQSACIRIENV